MSAVLAFRGVCAGALLTALSACMLGTSPAPQFLQLETRPPAQAPPDVGPGPTVAVGDVTLPPTVDRQALVRRTRGTEVEIASLARWSAPLDTLVRRTLAFNLAERLPAGMLVLPGQTSTLEPERWLLVTFESLAPGAGREVLLDAHWLLIDAQREERILEGACTAAVGSASGAPADIAAAMSEAVAVLADAVAAALADAPAPRDCG